MKFSYRSSKTRKMDCGFFFNCKKNNYLTCFHILKKIYMGRCSVFLAIWKITEILYTFLGEKICRKLSPLRKVLFF